MTEKKDTPQEIDLIELFSNIGNWVGKQFQRILNIVLSIFYFFLRNIIWFALFIIVGIAVGFYFHKVTKLYYNSEMIIYSNTVSNSEVIKTINDWNFSSVFTEEELENIKSLSATYLLDINGDNLWDIAEDIENLELMDTNIMKQRVSRYFSIQLEVFDTSLISKMKLNNSIISYLSDNKRVTDLNKIRIKQKEDLLPKYQKEIDDLSSLKEIEYFEDNKPTTAKLGEMLLIGEKETKLYYQQILALTREMQQIERDLFLNPEPFEVILDFSVPTIEQNNLFKLIINSLKVFLVIGFIIILFFDKRKFMLHHIKKAKEEYGWSNRHKQ